MQSCLQGQTPSAEYVKDFAIMDVKEVSVTVLARRSIQHLIGSSTSYLTAEQVGRLVDHLNRGNRDSIEAEWELIALAALNSVGQIIHEPDLGGPAKLDVRFSSPELKFVADITAVSDDAYDRVNPVQKLAREIGAIAMQLEEKGVVGSWYFNVKGTPACVRERVYKTKLRVPSAHRLRKAVFDLRFRRFLEAIQAAPNEVHQHTIDTAEAGLEFRFTPGGTGIQFSHLSYNLPHDQVHNVVYQALERKSDQMKRAGKRREDEFAGVIICDGGCAMLRTSRGVNNLAVDQVVNAFLRGSQSIDFVCVVDIVHTSTYNFSSPLRFDVRGWAKPKVPRSLSDITTKAFASLPTPIANAINTLGHFSFAANIPRNLGRYKGAGIMSHRRIEISLRAVMDYVSGLIDREEFERIVHTDWLQQLRTRLEHGRSISAVSIDRHPEIDDDLLTIEFGDYDAARAPFRTPPLG